MTGELKVLENESAAIVKKCAALQEEIKNAKGPFERPGPPLEEHRSVAECVSRREFHRKLLHEHNEEEGSIVGCVCY